MFFVVQGIASAAYHGQFREQTLQRHDRVRCVAAQPPARKTMADYVAGNAGQERFPDTGAVGRCTSSYPRSHESDWLETLQLLDVDNLHFIQDGEMHGLPGFVAQPIKLGQGRPADIVALVVGLGELQAAETEGILAGLLVSLNIAVEAERRQLPKRGAGA